MTIPANSRREFFIRSSAAIDPATLVGDNGKSLEIKGYYALDGGAKVEYCYKPNPLLTEESLQAGLPLFIPCDFDTSREISLMVETGRYNIQSPTTQN